MCFVVPTPVFHLIFELGANIVKIEDFIQKSEMSASSGAHILEWQLTNGDE